MNLYAPEGASTRRRLRSLLSSPDPSAAALQTSSRMVRLLAAADHGSSLTIEWRSSSRGFLAAYASANGLQPAEVEWALEDTARLGRVERRAALPLGTTVFAVDALPEPQNGSRASSIGFGDREARTHGDSNSAGYWAKGSLVPAHDLTAAIIAGKATVRVTARPSTQAERAELVNRLIETLPSDAGAISSFAGESLAVEILIAVPTENIPARLKAVLAQALPHVRFPLLGSSEDESVQLAWNSPGDGAQTLPQMLAQSLLLIPTVHPSAPVSGIDVEEPPARQLPKRHKEIAGRSLELGRSTAVTGSGSKSRLGVIDARRHTQIVGQTGSGKSTAIVQFVLEVARGGYGMTFLDPHGATVDRIIRALPKEARERVVLVRLADTDNPVRTSMWSSTEPAAVEQAVAELLDLMYEIFDPQRTGILGPRFERWFSLNSMANVALLGRDASFGTLVALSSTAETNRDLARAVKSLLPDASMALNSEFAKLGDKEFTEISGWASSKVQRFASVPALRETFGSGADAIDFATRIEERAIVLVDLGMPQLGTAPARMAGTLFLQKLWPAITARGVTDRAEDTHFLFLDEAHQFQNGPLPRMLAEGRKFGLAVVVAHQHAGQLDGDLRNALEANAGSLLAFRAAASEAGSLAARLGDNVALELPRLPALTAIATLCIEGSPSPAFTLTFSHPQEAGDAEMAIDQVWRHTLAAVVDPHRNAAPLTTVETLARLRNTVDRLRHAEERYTQAMHLIRSLNGKEALASVDQAIALMQDAGEAAPESWLIAKTLLADSLVAHRAHELWREDKWEPLHDVLSGKTGQSNTSLARVRATYVDAVARVLAEHLSDDELAQLAELEPEADQRAWLAEKAPNLKRVVASMEVMAMTCLVLGYADQLRQIDIDV